MSLLCRRATRFSAVVGTVLAGAVLVGSAFLARLTAAALHANGHASQAWTGTGFAGPIAGSLILILLVIALGAPVRAEEEDLIRASFDDE